MLSRVPRGFPAALAVIGLLVSGPAAAQAVSEDIHSPVTGPTEICGITAFGAAAFIKAVRADPSLHRAQIDSDRFELFVSKDEFTQWVFTNETEPAHPAITCRQVSQDQTGAWVSNRSLRCDGDRATCDALFLEFESMDRAMAAELRRTIDDRRSQP